MAANRLPIFPKAVKVGKIKSLRTMQIDKEGVESTTLFTAGPEGSRIDEIRAWHAGGNSSAAVLRFFIIDQNDTTGTIIDEFTINIHVIDETAESIAVESAPTNYFCLLGPNQKLTCSLGAALDNGIHITAFGGDY